MACLISLHQDKKETCRPREHFAHYVHHRTLDVHQQGCCPHGVQTLQPDAAQGDLESTFATSPRYPAGKHVTEKEVGRKEDINLR